MAWNFQRIFTSTQIRKLNEVPAVPSVVGRKNGLCSVYFPYIVTLEEHADGLVIIRSNWISKERPNYCFYPTKVKDMTKYLQRRENVKPKTTQVENEETPQDEETPEDVVNT